jgi:predicted transcriptional regulator YheO
MEAVTLACINLNNPTEASILAYNIFLEDLLMVNKEKRELIKSETKPMFDDLVANLLTQIKRNIEEIQTAIKNDGW